jgi:hypothetical protein
MWVITRRGWSALRGEMIPEGVKVWRNRILDHLGEQTNMYKVMHQYQDKIAATKHKGKDINQEADYIKKINFYDANEWVQWGEAQQGRLGL